MGNPGAGGGSGSDCCHGDLSHLHPQTGVLNSGHTCGPHSSTLSACWGSALGGMMPSVPLGSPKSELNRWETLEEKRCHSSTSLVLTRGRGGISSPGNNGARSGKLFGCVTGRGVPEASSG